jgi:hypothetical protein
MEYQKNKSRRAIRFRSKQVIIELREKYEFRKGEVSPTQICKDHVVTVGTFYTWLKFRRESKYKAEGRFIAPSVEPVAKTKVSTPIPVFVSISSGELTVQLH